MFFYCYVLFFFFSSRRRHTRSLCDWSSDVCSSDLGQLLHLLIGCLGELVAAVADIDAPQSGHPVEDLVALRIVDERPVGAGDDARAGFPQLLVVGERMQMMRGVDLLQLPQRIILVSHWLDLLR